MKWIVFVCLFLASPAYAQSMGGLTIGQTIPEGHIQGTLKSGAQKIGAYVARKWHLDNGDDLSATVDHQGRIVYIEEDMQDGTSGPSPYSPFKFGKTTLRQIREELGSNGFLYSDHMGFPIGESFALFNTYGLTGHPDLVRSFVTLMNPDTLNGLKENPHRMGEAVLVSTVVATRAYLATIWGQPGRPDDGYVTIPSQ